MKTDQEQLEEVMASLLKADVEICRTVLQCNGMATDAAGRDNAQLMVAETFASLLSRLHAVEVIRADLLPRPEQETLSQEENGEIK